MANGLAFRPHDIALGSKVTIRIDLYLHAAVAENSFGDDRHHVDALDLRRNDEGGRLVVRISRPRSNGSHERSGATHNVAVPVLLAPEEGNDAFASGPGTIEDDVWIDAHQLPVAISVAIASAQSSRFDVAEHRTGIAADCIVSHEVLRFRVLQELPPAAGLVLPVRGELSLQSHRGSHSESPGQSGLRPAHPLLLRRRDRPGTGPQSGSIRLVERLQSTE